MHKKNTSKDRDRRNNNNNNNNFSSSLGLELNLNYRTPSCCTEEGEVVEYSKIMQKLRGAQQEKLKEQVAGQNWQG